MENVTLEIGKEKTIDLEDGRRLVIVVDRDDCCHDGPRDWDNMGTMVCWHSRYNLGDEQPQGSPDEWRRDLAMSLDPTVEDRIWHWESGDGWTALANKEERATAELAAELEAAKAEDNDLSAKADEAKTSMRELIKELAPRTETADACFTEYSIPFTAELAGLVAEAAADAEAAEAAAEESGTAYQRAYDAWRYAKTHSSAVDACDARVEAIIDQTFNEQIAVILPLYLYDHGGITMNVGGYSCAWDSGQVGWIYVSKADVRREYSLKRLSKKARKLAEGYLRGEVETYAMYLEGRVYGYSWYIEEPETCNSCALTLWRQTAEDSCWGFYGWPDDYMVPEEINPALAEYGVEVSA